MAQKCVHKGCGKTFTDPDEACVYHPGPPIFHEGQKGWKCCKPRVLTFDEFLAIPPCTTGRHSTVDDTPKAAPKPSDEETAAKLKANEASQATPQRVAQTAQPPQATPSPAPPPEDESDDPDARPEPGASCKRRACGASYTAGSPRDEETCVYHPGQALFHEGSKGWTCCKRRVLEFDAFMNIPGCATKPRHLFVGAKKPAAPAGEAEEEQQLASVRSDFYQTPSTVIASLYLKKIDPRRSTVAFTHARAVHLDLHTTDNKSYKTSLPLFAPIAPSESRFKLLPSKLELTLAKADAQGWPVLRADDPLTGSIIQAGRAGRA